MKSPITDAVATLFILLTVIVGGYFYLTNEADKIIQQKAQPEQKHEKREVEKSTMQRLAPKSFAAVVKRTE